MNWTALLGLTVSMVVTAQGTFVYDQESTSLIEGNAFLNVVDQPMGQSFTPSLQAVSFVTLYLYDANFTQSDASIRVNLRTLSVTGPVLGSTEQEMVTNNFVGQVTFLFPSPVAVTPGQTYYLQPEAVNGDVWGSYVTTGYASGAEILAGSPFGNRDLWFREGIFVPEPSTALLLELAVGLLLMTRCRRQETWRSFPPYGT